MNENSVGLNETKTLSELSSDAQKQTGNSVEPGLGGQGAEDVSLDTGQEGQCGSEGRTGPAYRRNGNVARLPKAVRDKVNVMIQDGLTYAEIIERLGEDGKELDYSNL